MSDNTEKIDDFRPKIGDGSIPIPSTLEIPRTVGKMRYRGRLYLAGGLGVLLLAFVVFGLFLLPIAWYLRPLFLLIFAYLSILGIRYLILEERSFRKDFKRQDSTDYQIGLEDIWGIYNIDSSFPYLVNFRNNRIGLFVAFDRGMLIGKDYEEGLHAHYDALAEAMRDAGDEGVQICHIDYMGSIGADDRFDTLYADLINVQNIDARNVLTSIYAHLEADIESASTPLDVYLFSGYVDPTTLFQVAETFGDSLVPNHFLSRRYLDADDIRIIVEELFNLNTFSATDAILSSVTDSYAELITPLALKRDGKVIDLRENPDFLPSRSARHKR